MCAASGELSCDDVIVPMDSPHSQKLKMEPLCLGHFCDFVCIKLLLTAIFRPDNVDFK